LPTDLDDAGGESRCWSNITFRYISARRRCARRAPPANRRGVFTSSVELKQWSRLHFEGDPEIVKFRVSQEDRGCIRDQGGATANTILDSPSDADRPDFSGGMAYRHNAYDPPRQGTTRRYRSQSGPTCTAADKGVMFDFLRSRLAPVSGRQAADL